MSTGQRSRTRLANTQSELRYWSLLRTSRPFRNQEATKVLSQLNYQSVSEDALLVQLEDRPGALAELLKSCRSEAVTIRNIRLLWRGHGHRVVAIATTSPNALKTILKDRILLS